MFVLCIDNVLFVLFLSHFNGSCGNELRFYFYFILFGVKDFSEMFTEHIEIKQKRRFFFTLFSFVLPSTATLK